MQSKIVTKSKLAQKCANMDDPIDTYIVEPIAMLFSNLFLKMKLHPNLITGLSVIFGVVGGFLLIPSKIIINLIAILSIFLSAVFDASDGQVARLGTKKSKYGRWIDGLGDTIVYSAIYIGVSVHLMSENIPFTNVQWGWWIWILAAICGLFLHSNQAKMADYFRNIHMFVVNNEKGTSLERAKDIKAKNDLATNPYDRFFLGGSFKYTRSQERRAPLTQKLLDAMEQGDDESREKAKEIVAKTSNKCVWTTNLLTFNVRTIFIVICIILDATIGIFETFSICSFIYPFIMFVLEPLNKIMTGIYEKSAFKAYNEVYKNNIESTEKVA